MKLYLIRHGLLEEHYLTRLAGSTDALLSQEGEKQAEKLGEFLKDKDVATLYSSDLKRCKTTAEIINTYLQKELIIDKRLREIDFGEWEGKSIFELPPCEKDKSIKPPGGEDYIDFQKRVNEFLQELLKNGNTKSNKNLVIISHGGVCREILFLLNIISRDRYIKQDYGCVNVLLYQENQWIGEKINFIV